MEQFCLITGLGSFTQPWHDSEEPMEEVSGQETHAKEGETRGISQFVLPEVYL